MIWITAFIVFVLAAGRGGERWLGKTIGRMAVFAVLCCTAERNMGAVFAAGIIIAAAWTALSLFEAETKRKRRSEFVKKQSVHYKLSNN